MSGDNIIRVLADGQLHFAGQVWRCAIGANGMTPQADKREGDKKSPVGVYPLRRCFYRADKLANAPKTVLDVLPTSEDMGWCDDTQSASYNQLVTLPFEASHERMWRDDDCYDIVVELGHNDSPPVVGFGSAVFMHVARENYKPTEGCVALAHEDLLVLLALVGTDTLLEFVAA